LRHGGGPFIDLREKHVEIVGQRLGEASGVSRLERATDAEGCHPRFHSRQAIIARRTTSSSVMSVMSAGKPL
jgi:hypothetical protein